MQKIKNTETVAGVHTGNSIKKKKIKSKIDRPIIL